MKHSFKWDSNSGNKMCIECDNCFAHKCSWIRNNVLPEKALMMDGKIWFCPNYERNGETIEEYPMHILETYVKRVKDNADLKAENKRLRGELRVARVF